MLKAGVLAHAFRLPFHYPFVGNGDLWQNIADPGLWPGKCGNQIYPGDGTSQCLAVHGVVAVRIGTVSVRESDGMVALSGFTVGECLFLSFDRFQDKPSRNGAGDCYRAGSYTAEECFGGERKSILKAFKDFQSVRINFLSDTSSPS